MIIRPLVIRGMRGTNDCNLHVWYHAPIFPTSTKVWITFFKNLIKLPDRGVFAYQPTMTRKNPSTIGTRSWAKKKINIRRNIKPYRSNSISTPRHR